MAGNYKSTDSIINSAASARAGGATAGVKFQIANAEVQLGGLTDKEYNDFLNANFLATSNDGGFNSIKNAINQGKPVMGHILSYVTYKPRWKGRRLYYARNHDYWSYGLWWSKLL